MMKFWNTFHFFFSHFMERESIIFLIFFFSFYAKRVGGILRILDTFSEYITDKDCMIFLNMHFQFYKIGIGDDTI